MKKIISIVIICFVLTIPCVYADYTVVSAGELWDILVDSFGNEYAAAGIMANIMAESGLASNNLENSANTQYGVSDAEYTAHLNNGGEPYASSYGYGLCQWSAMRHINLVNYMRDHGYDVSDPYGQIEFLKYELENTADGYYSSSWYSNLNGNMMVNIFANESTLLSIGRACTAVSGVTDEKLLKVIGASEVWLHGYEKPANQGESTIDSRANVAMDYYNTFKGTTGQNTTPGDINKDNSTNIIDVKLLLQKVIAGISNPSFKERTSCDMNKDGEINIIDVKILLKNVIEN